MDSLHDKVYNNILNTYHQEISYYESVMTIHFQSLEQYGYHPNLFTNIDSCLHKISLIWNKIEAFKDFYRKIS